MTIAAILDALIVDLGGEFSRCASANNLTRCAKTCDDGRIGGNRSYFCGNPLPPVIRCVTRREHAKQSFERKVWVSGFLDGWNFGPHRRALLVRHSQNPELACLGERQNCGHWRRKNLDAALGKVLYGQILVGDTDTWVISSPAALIKPAIKMGKAPPPVDQLS